MNNKALIKRMNDDSYYDFQYIIECSHLPEHLKDRKYDLLGNAYEQALALRAKYMRGAPRRKNGCDFIAHYHAKDLYSKQFYFKVYIIDRSTGLSTDSEGY